MATATKTDDALDSKLMPPKDWAKANGFPLETVYEFCRIKHDPMPHLRIGSRIYVDDIPARRWLRRKFGVGCGGGK